MKLNESRVAELLKPFLTDGDGRADTLSRAQLETILMYVDILIHWNERINLTSVRQPEEIVTRHFGEAIYAARLLFPKNQIAGTSIEKILTEKAAIEKIHVIDIGSGAGFPGLPIKIWNEAIELTLIESNQKKSTFLRETIRKLGLHSAAVFAGRAEVFAGARGQVVTLRAVERFDAVLPIAAGLLVNSGRLAMLAGISQVERARAFVPGIKWDEAIKMPLSSNRAVVLGTKNHFS